MTHNSASFASLASPRPPKIENTCSLLSGPPLLFALPNQALGSPYPAPPILTSFAHRQLQPSLSAGFHNLYSICIYIYIYVCVHHLLAGAGSVALSTYAPQHAKAQKRHSSDSDASSVRLDRYANTEPRRLDWVLRLSSCFPFRVALEKSIRSTSGRRRSLFSNSTLATSASASAADTSRDDRERSSVLKVASSQSLFRGSSHCETNGNDSWHLARTATASR